LDQLFKEHSIDTVVHFAAESHVDRSITGPAAFIETNITGTFQLLEAARESWLGHNKTSGARFHHVSTDEVYGDLGPNDPPFTEETSYAPSSPYSASKAASDHLVRAYVRTYGLPATISNCSNNYGPFQFPEKLIPVILLNALQGRKIPVYGDGQQVRDWLYVTDHCEAVHRIVRSGTNGATYNIGGNNQPTNLAVVKGICGILDDLFPDSPNHPHSKLIDFVTDRPGHDRRYAMDISLIQRELGWTPRHSLQSGLQTTIQWYLDNAGWLDTLTVSSHFKEWVERNYERRE